MVGAFAYGDVVLMEQFIAGTEVAIGVFEQDDDLLALSAVEIVPRGRALRLRRALHRWHD